MENSMEAFQKISNRTTPLSSDLTSGYISKKIKTEYGRISSVQFSSVSQSCGTICKLMDCSMPGLPVHCQLPVFTKTHIHRVGDAIQLSHPLSSPSPPAFNLSQHSGLFKCISSSYQVAKVLEFQLQNSSFQQIFRTDFL